MSVQLFDDLGSCNTLGPQHKSLYRHGDMARCPDRFHAFKFCMNNNWLYPAQKRDE
ncbi:hypothetical protein OF83DRAFT_1115816 [Amylostereum chailletii]|nr:hypothetical protein OF83DRAFT_1115816 [Amylostereum chailletii]